MGDTRQRDSAASRPGVPWQQAWRRLKRDRLAIVSGVMIIFMILLAFVGAPIAERIVGHGPNDIISGGVENYEPVGPWSEVSDGKGGQTMLVLGASDLVGRDEFLRLLYGARVSLEVGILATTFGLMLGVITGMLAGYYGGATDTLVSRLTEIIMAFPLLLFLIALSATVGDRLNDITFGGLLYPGVFSARAGDHPVLVVLPGAHHQIAGAVAAREGVRRGRAHGRLLELPDHALAPAAAPGRDDHRLRHGDDRDQHPARVDAVVPRRGPAGAERELGQAARPSACSSTRSSPG